ncbi:hypothetical protein QE370_000299 [Aeromicrobium sp. SORGH_AS981]|uniref:hypothetical protein n=1 Tax=Aeromicrobium sp. SORGH_AS_0981 TaxID=3041802 RepID=UPI0028665E88|nr:hypothetical protein [Aeromicrobium sp. SORGH_AS_0981]MDR6117115.1 hypothetical protein [Aeromicrobium sp. SORGH_AS_0981]
MTNPDVPDLDRSSGERALDVATDQLRHQPASPHVAQAAGRVLARALAAPRRATTIETADPLLQVSSVALVALLRSALADEVADAAVRRIRLDVRDRGRLHAVHLELVARYGTSVPESTEATHAVTRRVLARTLGTGPAPGADDVTRHVHVSDVTHGDPHLAEPLDEDQVGDA